MDLREKRAGWMKGKWGVFVHYLPDQASATKEIDFSPEKWNNWIDNFNVDRLASQLANVGADYFFITVGQNSGYYLSPNKAYDEIVERSDSRLSHRDLVAELAEAITAKGIKFMVYVSSHAPSNDRFAVEKLGCTPVWDATRWAKLAPGTYKIIHDIDERLTVFQLNWERIMTEWSSRWGDKVSGWFIDGCYFSDILYEHDDAPNYASFSAALRAGNPDSALAFNTGVKVPVVTGKYDDYAAGELSSSLSVPTIWDDQPEYVNGVRYQVLTFLGPWWGAGEVPRFPAALALGYTELVCGHGGAMTWDVPVARTGEINDSFMRALETIGQFDRQA